MISSNTGAFDVSAATSAAIACAPLLGNGADLALPESVEARARLDILIWEAGASALEVPHLGPWIWGSPETFEAMIRGPAHAALRDARITTAAARPRSTIHERRGAGEAPGPRRRPCKRGCQ